MNPNENAESPTVLLRRLHHWRMAFFGVVILLAGVLSGAAVTFLVIGHLGRPALLPPDRDLIERLTGPLHLTAEQSRQAGPILQKHMAKLGQIRDEGQKAIAEELRLMSREMAGVLTDEQMRLWERLFLDLPGPMRHIPQEMGPGFGRGPAPPGGWRGPPTGRRGPLHIPSEPLPPEANVVPHN